MPGTTTPFKLGVLALVGIAGLLAIGFALGWRTTHRERIDFHTYVDGSVQGLDRGAPVKYRGVPIGNVGDIAIAPDRVHVEIELSVEADAARRLQLADASSTLRAELAIQGVTGVKFIDLDFGRPHAPAPPPLPFPPAPRYIPSQPSRLEGIGGHLEATASGIPTLVEEATAAMRELTNVLDEIDDGVAELQLLARDVRAARLPGRAAATLARADRALAKIESTAAKLDRADALIASATRASDAVADVGRSTRRSTAELEDTLRELAAAARAVRDFMEAVEREPDMLVKGRARGKR